MPASSQHLQAKSAMSLKYRRPCRTLLLILYLLPGATVSAQSASFGFGIGAAKNLWSGPYQEGGTTNLLATAFGELGMSARMDVRAELGLSTFGADFGTLGFLSDATTATVGEVHIGGLARWNVSPRVFLELGGQLWRQTACDVDEAGGPGFLGGRTVDCEDWEVEFEGARPLTSRAGGAAVLAGTGLRFRRVRVGLRYTHALNPVIESTDGSLRARQLSLMGEWAWGHAREQ